MTVADEAQRVSEFDRYARLARAAAAGDGPEVLEELTALGDDTKRYGGTLRHHGVSHLAVAALTADGLLPPEGEDMPPALRSIRRVREVDSQVFIEAFAEIQSAFDAAGIPALLMKGIVLAQRLYGGLNRRPQFDLDVLVQRRALFSARRTLAGLGYANSSHDRHSLTMRRDKLKVDLHWALRAAPGYSIDRAAIWREAVPVRIEELRVQTLSDGHLLTLIAASAVEDTALGMIKLKQLCDLWLLARELDPAFDWEAWLWTRKLERLEVVVVNGLALALEVLNGAGDTPRLAEALDARSHLVRVSDRNQALALVAARRADLANMAWFGEVYSGSTFLYRVVSFIARLPDSIRDVQLERYLPEVSVKAPWSR